MITLTQPDAVELRPRITVFGVGGAGGNAVNNMIDSKLEGVEFVVANTDSQALAHSRATRRIQLGRNVTQGLGAGARPEIGRASAEEAMDLITEYITGSHMCFITAGMGGGTGTGAGPVIARAARELGVLTVGVVTKPFQFEGAHRMRVAEAGIEALQEFVDTLIIIPNQNLFRVANEKTTFAQAFAMADNVLHSGVRGVTDLMIMPGLINLDFADVRTVMSEMGKAMMGTGEATGDRRAIEAAEAAISNPLLDEVSMKGARGVLINITGGLDLTLFEVDEAANRIRSEVDPDANIIVGSTFDQEMDGRMRVSVVATGIEMEAQRAAPPQHLTGNVTAIPRRTPEVREAAPQRPAAFSGFGLSGGGGGGAATAQRLEPVHEPVTAQAQPEPVVAQAQPAPQAYQAPQPQVAAPVRDEQPQAGYARAVQPAPQVAPPPPARPAVSSQGGAFIAPRPVSPSPTPGRPAQQVQNPFAETQAAAPRRKSLGLSLIERVTGRRSEPAAPPAPAPQPAVDPYARAPQREPLVQPPLTQQHAPQAQPQTPVPQAQAPHSPARESSRLDRLDPHDRVMPARAGTDDQLEIPAFLRRQAN
ncbi:cell division protein FtsZ [Zavarzinia sp. CC-PAN008]|uniref:cell division protein FtsZ n=1 Tax=Zavarzinia sp. CC-PAN008 TaxID=3243332 RepID=UPI003F749FE9